MVRRNALYEKTENKASAIVVLNNFRDRRFEGMEYTQRACFGYECLEDGDSYT
jgi:hypothetical protein